MSRKKCYQRSIDFPQATWGARKFPHLPHVLQLPTFKAKHRVNNKTQKVTVFSHSFLHTHIVTDNSLVQIGEQDDAYPGE